MADIITLIVGPVALYLVSLIVGIVAPSLLGLFDAVVPHLLDPIGRELDYLFHYRSNIEKLSDEVDELQKVSETIKDAWTNAGEIELVQEWLTSVDGIIKNALKFLEDEKKENEGFFNRLCAWYQKIKKAKQTAAEIASQIQKGNRLSSSAPPRKIKIPAVEGYEAFKSRMPILKNIMEALSNPNVNIIGVYGMGGTGKTMLANKVARKCEEDKLFDEVVMTVVSQPPDLRKIQGEIVEKLNLKLEKETKSVRASLLCEELKKLLVDKKKSILVILDDIWKKLDLTEVGIPFGNNYRGCKIVVTSRNQHVLSNEMGAQHVFHIEVLPKEEAWDLFKKIAGDSIERPDLHPTAIEVVKECGGLPIAIATVASALKNNEDLHIWKDALRKLTMSTPTNIGEMHPKVYLSLKLSYDFQSKEAKSLFLLCSLFPEDYQFSITDILKYGEGLGLFQEINALEEARDEVHTLVYKLKDSSLLLDNNPTGFRLHDVVRDVGIYVASEDEHMLIVKNDIDPEEQRTEEKLRNCRAISLPYSNIQELPEGLKCPKLNFFLLFTNDPSLKIPETFFKGMEQLKVLSLRFMCFSSLPSSLRFLSNLRTLCLDDCVFQDIPRHDLARIGELKKLEVLSFAGSNIAELPGEIRQLTCLRLLDLRNCSELKVILPNIIAKLTRLEDLYMAKSFKGWEVDGNASLAELKHLSRLVTLDNIHIPDTNIIPKDLRFENLMRYRISIGDDWGWYGDYETSRTLKLKLKTSIEQFGLNSLLEKTEDLYLGEMNGNKNGLCSSNREVFPQLRHLHVQKGCEMEYVVNTLELIPDKAFPELRSLFLHNLINLKKICHGQLPTESFSNLRIVEVESCNSLKNLFSLSVVKSLRQLRTLKIKDCEIMDEIVSEGSEASEGNNEAMGKITFPQLHSLELWTLPKLSSFYSKKQTSRPFNNCAPTTDAGSGEIISEAEHDIPIPLFNEKVVFPNLEKLKLKSMSSMKEIWQDQYYAASFGKLKVLEVCDCESLTHLLTFAIAKCLVQIQSIIVDNCKMMKEVIASEEGNETDDTTFSQLKSLKLRNLPNLTSFYTRSNSFSFPSLEEVLVEKCPELKTFSYGILHTPKLDKVLVLEDLNTTIKYLFGQKAEFVRLFELSELKEICHNQFTVEDCYVQYLVVEKCTFLLKVFSSTMLEIFSSNMLESIRKLEKITVESCDSLEQVFDLVGLNCDKESAGPLSNLEEMNLTEHPKGILCLRCIWNKDPKGILSFQYLRRLNIYKCNSLRNLFSCSMALDLQLEGLKITDCLNMEEIVGKEKGAMEEAIDKIVFRCLRYIILEGLPNLTSFYPGNHTLEFPSLSLMKTIRCPGINTFTSIDVPSASLFINNKVTFPNLESLTVMDMFAIDSLEYVFDLGGLNDKEKPIERTPQLRDLGLHSVWKLKQIWKTDSQVSGYFPFQNLTSLSVIDCRNLRHIFTTSMAKSLVQLQELEIVGCWQMEEIVENDEVEKAAIDRIVFPQVIYLSLIQLEQLKSFCQGIRISEWPSLKRVLLNDCSDVEILASELSSFEESQGKGKVHVGTPRKQPLFLVDKVAFPKLEELKLVDMRSLKEIWQGQFHAPSFCKLTTLEVQCCGSLTHLLPSAIAKSLAQIKSIFVRDCWMMTEIIASEEREEAADEITFSQLNSLKLKNLPDLTSIYAGSNSFSFPTLKEVLVEKCPKLNTFSTGMLNTPALEKVHIESEGLFGEEVVVMDKWVWKDNLNSTIQHLFLQKMEFLRLSEQSELKQICYDQFLVEACYARYLVVEKCTSLLNVVSSNILESLRKLEKITVESCDSLEQVFDLEGLDCDEKRGRLLLDLEEMNLTELPKLRCIWNKDPKGILSFKYLRQLNIHKCNSLRNVFSLSMVPNLWRHGGFELKITDCLNMEEIVEMEKEAIDKIMFHEIMFQCSRCILQGLPSLTSFYPGNHTLVFTNLGTLKIVGCPRIKTFTSTNEGLQETSGDGNVDVPSSALFINNKVEFPWLYELELEDLYSIKEIWQGHLHADSFCMLTTLTVRSCQNLTHLLPFEIAKRLVEIKSITVDSCKMMKEIIVREEGEEADHETTFSQLSSLKLRSLSNLTNFCTGSTTFSFPSLEQVLVEECLKLKTFSSGILKAPKLEKVQVQEHEWVWKDDLNTTIQHLFAQKGDHL